MLQGLIGGSVTVFLVLFVTGIREHGFFKSLFKAALTSGGIFLACLIGYAVAGIL